MEMSVELQLKKGNKEGINGGQILLGLCSSKYVMFALIKLFRNI